MSIYVYGDTSPRVNRLIGAGRLEGYRRIFYIIRVKDLVNMKLVVITYIFNEPDTKETSYIVAYLNRGR